MYIYFFLFPSVLFAAAETKYKVKDRIQVTAKITISGQTYFSNFFPKVDKLSMLRVPLNTSGTTPANIKGATIQFYSGGNNTLKTPEYQLTKDDLAVEFLSLIIFLDKGVNNAISWDTSFDTNSCKNRRYIDKTCAVQYDQTAYTYLKVFTAFVGTDSSNTPLTSGQSLPSTFVKFGVGGVIDDATKFVNKAGDWFKDKF